MTGKYLIDGKWVTLTHIDMKIVLDKAEKWDAAVEWYGDMVNEYHGAVMDAGMFKQMLDEIRNILQSSNWLDDQISQIHDVISKYDR